MASASRTRQPFSEILGTRAKVAALRVLGGGAGPLTQREVARRSHVQHRSMQVALDLLVTLGIVTRVEGGRDFLVTLNPEHRLVAPLRGLFRAEATFFNDLRQVLVGLLRDVAPQRAIASAVLFGSVARGIDGPASDLDLLLIIRDEQAVEAVADRLRERGEVVRRQFGLRLSPIGYTLAESRRLYRARRPPFPGVIKDHIPLFGPPLLELLRGQD